MEDKVAIKVGEYTFIGNMTHLDDNIYEIALCPDTTIDFPTDVDKFDSVFYFLYHKFSNMEYEVIRIIETCPEIIQVRVK